MGWVLSLVNIRNLIEVIMVVECIFFIIKFNVVVKNNIGVIYVCFESVGFKIIVVKMLYLIKE